MTVTDPKKWKVGTSYDPYGSDGKLNLEEIKAAGMSCIEMVLSNRREDLTSDRLTERYDPIIKEAHQRGLEIWSVHLPFGDYWDISKMIEEKRNQILESHNQWLDWVAKWGIKKVIIHPSFEPISKQERSDRLETAKQSLEKLAEKAKTLGIEICVECLPRTCLGNSSEEIEYLISGSDDLGVCCDVNHLLSETPTHFINRIGSRISTVHLSDYDGIDEKHWMPGEGIINWEETIRSLANTGYKGPFMFEVSAESAEEISTIANEILNNA